MQFVVRARGRPTVGDDDERQRPVFVAQQPIDIRHPFSHVLCLLVHVDRRRRKRLVVVAAVVQRCVSQAMFQQCQQISEANLDVALLAALLWTQSESAAQ